MQNMTPSIHAKLTEIHTYPEEVILVPKELEKEMLRAFQQKNLDIAKVTQLLQNHKDLYKFGLFILKHAITFGHLDIVKHLVEKEKIDMSLRHNHVITNLWWYIFFAKVKPQVKTELITYFIKNDRYKKFKDGTNELVLAALSKNIAKIQAYKLDVNNTDIFFNTPLHYAAMTGDEKTMLACLELTDINLNAQGMYGKTPLMLAVLFKQPTLLIKKFLSMGAQVRQTNIHGLTPLHFAAIAGRFDLIPLLVKDGADVNAEDKQQFNPYLYAAINNHPQTLQMLIDHGAKPNFTCHTGIKFNNETYDLLQYAAIKGYLEIIPLVFKTFRVPSNDDWFKTTSLMYAILHNTINVQATVKKLLDLGVNVKQINAFGETALHLAADTYNVHIPDIRGIMALLLKHGADINACGNGPVEGDDCYETPLTQAVMYAALTNNFDSVNFLLEVGADTSIPNTDGETPLHLAAKYGLIDIVKILLTKQTDIKSIDNMGQTPLISAIKSPDPKVAIVILEHIEKTYTTNSERAAYVNTTMYLDNQNHTALTSAVEAYLTSSAQSSWGDSQLITVKDEYKELIGKLVDLGANRDQVFSNHCSIFYFIQKNEDTSYYCKALKPFLMNAVEMMITKYIMDFKNFINPVLSGFYTFPGKITIDKVTHDDIRTFLADYIKQIMEYYNSSEVERAAKKNAYLKPKCYSEYFQSKLQSLYNKFITREQLDEPHEFKVILSEDRDIQKLKKIVYGLTRINQLLIFDGVCSHDIKQSMQNKLDAHIEIKYISQKIAKNNKPTKSPFFNSKKRQQPDTSNPANDNSEQKDSDNSEEHKSKRMKFGNNSNDE